MEKEKPAFCLRCRSILTTADFTKNKVLCDRCMFELHPGDKRCPVCGMAWETAKEAENCCKELRSGDN